MQTLRAWAKRLLPVAERPAASAAKPGVLAQGLRILITQRELKNYGGSELYAIECARALKARGAEVAVYCPSPGPLTSILSPSGIPVCDRPEAVPFEPQIIHGQHHLPTMAALAQFPDCPAIYVWHGTRPWVETPHLHPRIRYLLVTSQRMLPRIAVETGMPQARIEVLPNFVDMERFSRVKPPEFPPKRALLYGQSGFGAGELRAVEAACEAHGMSLEKIGYAYGNPRPRPEYFLPQYDVVFAIGRSALEAMAAGAAVIPIVPQLAGVLVTPERFESLAASNFSPRYFKSAEVFEPDWLGRQLAEMTPDGVAEVTAKVRADHGLEGAMDRLLALYQRAMAASAPEGSGPDFAAYLTRMASEVDAMWGDLEVRKQEDRARVAELAKLEAKLEAAEVRNAALTDRLLTVKPRSSATALTNGRVRG